MPETPTDRRQFLLQAAPLLSNLPASMVAVPGKTTDRLPVAAGPFILKSGRNSQPNEGPTDYRLHVRPEGRLEAVMVFVDFTDAPATERTQDLYERLVPYSQRWYEAVSSRQMSLEVKAVHKWYRMPRQSGEYGFRRGQFTFELHRAYISDAAKVSANEIDFSRYKISYFVSSRNCALGFSPAFHGYPGTGVKVKGGEIRHAAAFGADIRVKEPHYGAHVFIHETGHLLGLPDLYEWKSPVLEHSLRTVGGWDIMGWVAPGSHFLGWHKWKLGWLKPKEIRWLEHGSLEELLSPLEQNGGIKAVVVRTGEARAYVIEARRPEVFQISGREQSLQLPNDGILIYTVDARVENGSLPIHIRPSRDARDKKLQRCFGPLYNAPFSVGHGEVSTFNDASVGLKVEVKEKTAEGYRVRVERLHS